MSATTTDVPPAYARRGDCPTWCTHHHWDDRPGREPAFMCHATEAGDGDDALELYLTAEGGLGAADMGNVERTPEQLRAFAARLVEAAETLEHG
ncbi:hypothetical protein [Humibacillus xanthopallidus]|uniref:Uncharacterized protein n=1 Tax=Humibacillus xanthopallidus TaxID=412689 RepID=A0A543HW94_9MICO|nr:hypothetical protein [Humibacillus xanthopallidus]TQM62594.1 hypothetical protein FBY41_2631 [Humibacillus xanthopallidus]